MVFALVVCVVAAPARAQFVPPPLEEGESAVEGVSLSGPRFGVTHLSDGVVAKLRNNNCGGRAGLRTRSPLPLTSRRRHPVRRRLDHPRGSRRVSMARR